MNLKHLSRSFELVNFMFHGWKGKRENEHCTSELDTAKHLKESEKINKFLLHFRAVEGGLSDARKSFSRSSASNDLVALNVYKMVDVVD